MPEIDSHSMLVTMAVAASAGIIVMAIAHRIHVSAIVLLLLGGVALGPVGIGAVQPDSLGDALPVVVSLAVGLILFEGGLTLDLKGYRSAPGVIRRLLSIGVIVTFVGIAAAIHFIGGPLLGVSPKVALLSASLVIVTGPTVIAPLLKRIRVIPKLHGILHWEGVLVDPIGVFLALLCFEWLSPEDGAIVAIGTFGKRVAVGMGVGVVGGFFIDRLIRWKLAPREMLNVFSLALALFVFGVAEAQAHEAGVLAVTVAGFILGWRGPDELKQVRAFKAEITELMIGMLFILLAARLDPVRFAALGAPGVVIVALVMFVVRPLNVVVSGWGQGLNWREKVFLSWVAPRGIVAASMASLFSLKLLAAIDPAAPEADRIELAANAEFVELFTYSVIVATVVLQGFTAGPLARLLKLRRPPRRGWLIVGAHRFGQRLARFMRDAAGVEVLLADSNRNSVALANKKGLKAVCVDARNADELDEEAEFLEIGNLLALTDNADLNILLCQRWAGALGEGHLFRWSARPESDGSAGTGRLVFATLPKPSAVSEELRRAGASLLREAGPPVVDDDGKSALLSCRSGGVVVDPCAIDDAEDRGDGPTLYVRREWSVFARSVRPDLVTVLTTRDSHEVLQRLADLAASRVEEISWDSLGEAARNQASSGMIGLGNGFAVPHMQVQGLAAPVCVVGKAPEGVEMETPDGEPVRLVILLLSPAGEPKAHLEMLADIARLASDAEICEQIIEADTPEALVRVAREFAQGPEAETESPGP